MIFRQDRFNRGHARSAKSPVACHDQKLRIFANAEWRRSNSGKHRSFEALDGFLAIVRQRVKSRCSAILEYAQDLSKPILQRGSKHERVVECIDWIARHRAP
jgi:hypothetical protein